MYAAAAAAMTARGIPASRRLSGTRLRGIDHRGCERLVGGDRVARELERAIEERGTGGGKVRGIALGTTPNPQRAISNPYLSLPTLAETGSQPP